MTDKQTKKGVKELQELAEIIPKVRIAFDLLTLSTKEATRAMRRIADCMEADYSRKRENDR